MKNKIHPKLRRSRLVELHESIPLREKIGVTTRTASFYTPPHFMRNDSGAHALRYCALQGGRSKRPSASGSRA
jgi:hypothetical protein